MNTLFTILSGIGRKRESRKKNEGKIYRQATGLAASSGLAGESPSGSMAIESAVFAVGLTGTGGGLDLDLLEEGLADAVAGVALVELLAVRDDRFDRAEPADEPRWALAHRNPQLNY